MTETVKVRLKISRAGVDFVQNAGEEIEVSAAEAKRMIEKDQCALVETTTKRSKAGKVEKAVE